MIDKYIKLSAILFTIIITLSNVINLQGQEKTKEPYTQIELKEFYDTKGVIFPSDYNFGYTVSYFSNKIRFTPTKEEIIKGERILSHLVNMLLGNAQEMKVRANNHMRSYLRQYLGAINEDSTKVIYILMLDPNSPLDIKNYWSTKFQLLIEGGLDYYRIYMVNINTKELDEISNPLILDYDWYFQDRKENK